MRALWNALPLAVFSIDMEGRVRDANPVAEQLCHASIKTLKGQELASLLRMDAAFAPALARFCATQGVVALPQCRVDGAPALVRISPFDEGALVSVDMMDGRISQRSSDAARTAMGLAEMLGHEIKNPLAGISGAAQLLGAAASAEDAPLADLIIDETRRIAALIDQVEQFGQQTRPTRQAVNLHDILERARRAASIGFASHMRFKEDYDPSLPEALTDPDHLQQILLNLLKNAAEANPKGGQITLRSFYDSALRRGDEALALHIEVIDDGPGLPEDIAAQAFEPFVSGKDNGTGLGLALVAKLAADNGAQIDLISKPNETRFRLSLVRAKETR